MSPRSDDDKRLGVLARVASLGVEHPRPVLLVAAVMLLVCGAVAWGLPVSTSRYNLVSADHPTQVRLLRFFERFGYPDSLVLVVTGADASARRAVVDKLTARLAQEPELKERVIGRVGLDQVAEVALLLQPDVISQLRERLGSDAEVKRLVEGGLSAWVDTMRRQMDAELEGEGEARSDDQARAGLTTLAQVLRALDAQLAGRDPRTAMPRLDQAREVSVDDRGYLIGSGGAYHVVALFPRLEGAEGYQVKPLVDKVRRARDDALAGQTGVQAALTGLPALVADELTIIKRGLARTSAVTTLGILVLLYLAFRSFRYTVLALLPLGVGLLLTLALVRPLYGGLNLVTSSFVPVLMGLGIDFGVYVLSRYGENVRAGDDQPAAIRGALGKAGPGMLIGGITTVIAFMMTTTTEFTAYSELGVITSLGLAVMMAVTFVVLPALIFVAGRGGEIHSPELPGVARLSALIHKTRWPVVAVAAVVVGLATTTWHRIGFNARFFDFLPESTESARGLDHIEHDAGLSPVQAGVGVESVEDARALAEKLRGLPSVGAVQTASDLLPKLTEERLAKLRASFSGARPDFEKLRSRKRDTGELVTALTGLIDVIEELALAMKQANRSVKEVDELERAAKALRARVQALPGPKAIAAAEQRLANVLERAWTTASAVARRGGYLPADLPAVFRARFVSKDGKALAVYANPAGDIWNEATARAFASEVQAVHAGMAGLAVSIHEHIYMIKEGFTRATVLAAGLVLVVLLVGFRKLFEAGMALLPVAVGVCWMLGAMGALGLHFAVANIVVLPLILGIGVDAGAHLMHRWRQSADDNGGTARLSEILRGTGAAVLLASLTTAVGFAALMLGDYGAMKTLGLTMTLGVGCCLVASILVLPAVLVLLRKAE